MFPASFDLGSSPSKYQMQCRYCPQTFVKFNELIKHEATHHVLPPPPPTLPPQIEIPVENQAEKSKPEFDGEEGTSEDENYEVDDLLDRFQDYWEETDNNDYLNLKQASKKVRNPKPTRAKNRKKKMYKPKEMVLFDCSIYNMRRLKVDGKSKFQCLTCLAVLSIKSRERLLIHQRTHNHPNLKKSKSFSSNKNKTSSNSVEITSQNRPSKVVSFDCTIYNMERVKVAGQNTSKFQCLTCSTILSSRSRSDLLRHQKTHEKNHQIQHNVSSTSQDFDIDHIDLEGEGEAEATIFEGISSNISTSNGDWVDNYISFGDDNQKKMKCLRCNKILTSRPSNLRYHFLIHKGDRPFICNFENCSAAFACEPYLNKHKNRVHGSKVNKSSNRPGSSKRFSKVTPVHIDYSMYGFEKVKIDGSKSKFKCLTCDKIFTFHSRERFLKHQNSHNIMPSENNQSSNHSNKLENFSNAFSKKSGHFENGIYSLEKFTNSNVNVIEDNEIEEPLTDADPNSFVEIETPLPPINPYVETSPINSKTNTYVQNDNSKLSESAPNFDQNEYENLKNHFIKISSNKYECKHCHHILSRGYYSYLKRHIDVHSKREININEDEDYVEAEDEENDFVDAEHDDSDDYAKALQNALKVLTKDERVAIIKKTLYKNLAVRLTRLPEEIVLKYLPKITNPNDESESISNTSSESESESHFSCNESEEYTERNINFPSIPAVPELVSIISNNESNSKPGKIIDNEIAEIIESIEKIESHKEERLRQKQIINIKTINEQPSSTNTNNVIINQDSGIKVDPNNEKSFEDKNMDQDKFQMSESDLIHQNGAICEDGNGLPISNSESILVCDSNNSFSNNLIERGNEVNSNVASLSKKESISETVDQLTNLCQVDGNNKVSSLTNSAQNEDKGLSTSVSNNFNEVNAINPKDDIVDIESLEIGNPIDIVDTPSEDEITIDKEEEIDIESSEINQETVFHESIANKVENEKEILQSDLQASQVQIVDSIPNLSIFDEKEKRMNTSNVSILISNQITDENENENEVEKNNKNNNDTKGIFNVDELNSLSAQSQMENEIEVEEEVEELKLPLAESQIADNVEKAFSNIENESTLTASISFDADIDTNGLVNLQHEDIIINTSPIIDDEIENIKNSQESQNENTNSMDFNESMREVNNFILPSNQEETESNDVIDVIEKESKSEENNKSSSNICESENVVKQDIEINKKVSCSNCSSKLMRKLEIRNIFKFSLSLPVVENKLNESMPLIDNDQKVRSFCYEFQYNETEDTPNTNENDSTKVNEDKSEKESNIEFENETCESMNTTTTLESTIKDGNTNDVIDESNSAVDYENENFPIKNECSAVPEMIYHEAEIIMNDSPREQPPEDSDESEPLITNRKEPSNIVLDGVLSCVYIDSRSQEKVEVGACTTNEKIKVADNMKLKLKSKTKTRIKAEMKSKTYLKKRKSILSNQNKNKKLVVRKSVRNRKSIENIDNHRRSSIKAKYELRNSSPKKLEPIILPAVLDCNYINESYEADQNQKNVDIEQDRKPVLTRTRSTRSSKSFKEVNIEKLGLLPPITRKSINKSKKTIFKRQKSKRIQKRLRLRSLMAKTAESAESESKSVTKMRVDITAEYNFEELEMSGKPKFKCLTCLCIFSNGSKGMLKGHQNTHSKIEKNENIDQVLVVDSSKELRRKSSRIKIKKEISNPIPNDKNTIIENTTVQLQSSNENKDKIVKGSKKPKDISKKIQNDQRTIRSTRKKSRRIYKSISKPIILFDSSIYNMKRLIIKKKSRFQCLTCSIVLPSHSRDRLAAHQRAHSISSQKETKTNDVIFKSLQIKKEKTSAPTPRQEPLDKFINVTSDQNSYKLSKVKLFDCSIYNMERIRIPGKSWRKFKCLTCSAILSENARSRLLKHQRTHQRNSQEMEITSTTLQNNEIVLENNQNNEMIVDESENNQNSVKVIDENMVKSEGSSISPNKTINEVLESNKSVIQIQTPGESNSDDWMTKFEKIGKYYRCLECNNNLSKTSPSYLKYHYNTHYGIRPFKCSKCPKSFFTNSHRKRHNDRVHNDHNVSGDSLMLKILSEPIQTMMVDGEVDVTRNYKKSQSVETDTGDSSSLPMLFPEVNDHIIDYLQVSVNNQGQSQINQKKATTDQKPNTKLDYGSNFYDWTNDYIKIDFGGAEIKYECTSCKQILSDPSIDALKSHKLTHTIKVPQYKKNTVIDQFGSIGSGANSNSLELTRSSKRKSSKNESNNKRVRIDKELGLDGNSHTLFYSKSDNEAFRKNNYKPVLIEGKVKNECLTCGATISSNLRRHFLTHNKPIRP